MELVKLIEASVALKPKFGRPCNNCGFCCLTEVCAVGQELSGKTVGPCPLLVREEAGRHYCRVALGTPEMRGVLGIGAGCCAETQDEVLARLRNTPKANTSQKA